MFSKRGKIGIVLGLLVVLAAGLIGRELWRRRGYELVHPKRGDLTEAIYGLGKVRSNKRFEVRVGVISTVKEVFVDEGDFVKRGARLIRFEPDIVFRAPFAGTVTFVGIDAGENAPAQTPVLRVEDLSDRYMELSLEQEGALRVKPGQNARVSFESLRRETLRGKVTALYSRQDEFLALVQVPDLSPSVLPGMTADVSVEVGTIKDALLVPLRAVRDGQVTVRKGRKLHKIKVDVGHVDGSWAEIRGDALSLEDEVAVPKSED
jgi:multidrug efflux pump subunit AcrA (membrane-fusion protein)